MKQLDVDNISKVVSWLHIVIAILTMLVTVWKFLPITTEDDDDI